MRRGLSILLMLVLVLRGLTGTAMAAGVLPPLQPPGAQHGHIQADTAHAPAEAQTAPSGAHGAHHGAPSNHQPSKAPATEPENGHGHDFDHDHDHDHASAAPASADVAACDGSTAGCAAHEHHATACSACEICHSAMLDVPAALTPAHLPTGPQRPLTSAQFDSAPAALAIKPPIA